MESSWKFGVFAYDAAGRLVKEGDRSYRYGYLDKVLSVTEGKRSYRYAYHADGQLARADYGDGRAEDFAWDGLALIRRGDEMFVNEPHVGGGAPVVSSKGAAYFNDILGTTVGVREGRGAARKKAKHRYTAAALTAFGEPVQDSQTFQTFQTSQTFFTGKPEVEGLGRVFLMRNYRADLAKWQTADPLGYPDGWNQLAYCGNDASGSVDVFGGIRKKESEKTLFDRPIDGTWHHYEWLPDGSEVLFQWWEKMVEITWGMYDVVYPGKEAQIKLEQGLEFTATVGGLAIAVIGLATGGMAYSIAGVAVGLAGLYAYLQDHENDSELRLRDTYSENKYSTYRVYKTIPE